MWHPNKAQWRVIWIAVILGLVFGVAVLFGALLVWQMERAMREATARPSTIIYLTTAGRVAVLSVTMEME